MPKSIPEVKIGNEVYELKDRTAREHLVEVSTTQPSDENNRLWIKDQEAEYEVPTIDEFDSLKSALNSLTLPLIPEMKNGRLNADTGEEYDVGVSDRWITTDYISTAYLKTLENNTSAGKTYIFYYNYANGAYVYQEPYVSTNPGSVTSIDSRKGTHLRLYSTSSASGRKVVLNQYISTLKDIQDGVSDHYSFKNVSLVYKGAAPENEQHLLSYLTDIGIYVTRGNQTWDDNPTENTIALFNIKITNNYTLQVAVDVVTGEEYVRIISSNTPVVNWIKLTTDSDLADLNEKSILYRGAAEANEQHLLSYLTDIGIFVTRGNQTWNDKPTSNNVSLLNMKIANNYTLQIAIDVVTGDGYLRIVSSNDALFDWIKFSNSQASGSEVVKRNHENERYYQAYSRTANDSVGANLIRFAHITDTHSDSGCWNRFLTYLDYIKPVPAAIIHSGDIVKTHINNDYSYMMDHLPDIPTIIAIGNHETGNSLEVGSGGATNATCKATFISPLGVKYSSFVLDPDADACYYYVDVKSSNNSKTLRVIVLNCYDYDGLTDGHFVNRAKMHYSKKQLDWLIEKLQEANVNGIPVCIVAHESDSFLRAADGINNPFNMPYVSVTSPETDSYTKQWEGNPVCDLIEAFITQDTVNATYYENEFSVSINTTFTKSGHFVCWFIGHRHNDHIGFLPNYSQMVISLANGGMTVTARFSDLPRYDGMKTEDCFNMYSIDLDAKTIGITRFGADVLYSGMDRKHTLVSYVPPVSQND